MHARVLRPRRARSMLAITHSPVVPSAHWNSVGALISDPFHGSIALPACASINASRGALRLHAHDTRPGWLARPYLYGSSIRDFTPAYPGALQLGPKLRPLSQPPLCVRFQPRVRKCRAWYLRQSVLAGAAQLPGLLRFRVTNWCEYA